MFEDICDKDKFLKELKLKYKMINNTDIVKI
jgi:hypothetical protein